jgi:hypothetical protein
MLPGKWAPIQLQLFLKRPFYKLPYNWFVVYADDSSQYYGIIG